MAPFVRIQNFGCVDGGFSLPYHAVTNFEDLDEIVFRHFEQSMNTFKVHYHACQEPDPCEFPISRRLWDTGTYLPKTDMGTAEANPNTLNIFAHFTPRRCTEPASDARRRRAPQQASNIEPAQGDKQTPPGLSAKEKTGGCVNSGSQSNVDRTRCSTPRVVRDSGYDSRYSYKDLNPSIHIIRKTRDGNPSLLVGHVRREGWNQNPVYGTPHPYQDRVDLRAVGLDMRGEHADLGGGSAVSVRDTVFFKELIAVADDTNALLEAVRERLKQGTVERRNYGAARLTSRRTAIGQADGGHASNDAQRTIKRSTRPSTGEAYSSSPSIISVRFVFKEGTRGIFRSWQDFHIDLPGDFSSERIVPQVEEAVRSKAERSTRLHPYRTNLRCEIHLGANVGSMALLTAGFALSDYAASQSDNSTGLLGHVYVYIYKDGDRLADFQEISVCEYGSERQSEPILSDAPANIEVGAGCPISRSRCGRSTRNHIVDRLFEAVVIDFVVTGSHEAARFFKSWSDLCIPVDADATYSEVKDFLRPHINNRLKKSKIYRNYQSHEHVSFDFTLEGKGFELLPLLDRKSLRDFVLEEGTGPRLIGQITIELPLALAPSDPENDVHMADPGPSNHLSDDRKGSLMQKYTPCPTVAPDSADGRRISSTSSPLSPLPSLLHPQRHEAAQDCHNQKAPITVVFKYKDRSCNGGKPFRFADVKWDFCGTAQQQELQDYLVRKVETKINMTFRPNADELKRTVTFDVDIYNGCTSSPLRPGGMLSDYLDEGENSRQLTANVVLRRKRLHES